MSRISSTVEAVEDLCIEPMPVRPVKVVRGCRAGRAYVVVSEGGTVYSSQVKAGCYYMRGTGMDDTLEACKRLGLLSKDALARHMADVQAVREADERKWAASSLLSDAKRLGLKFTADQRRTLRAAAGN